jgi:hypothetical protein
MRISAPRRQRRGAMRVDLKGLRDALADTRLWASLAIVALPEGEARPHWEIDTDESGNIRDIFVDVVLVPANIEVEARLSGVGTGVAMIDIPALGDEVIIVFPDGRLDHAPTIVARTSGSVRSDVEAQGPAPQRLVIIAPEVLIHNGDGTAEPLVRKSEFDAHREWALGHKHAGLLGGTASVAALTSPPASAPVGTPDPPPTITGTSVVKAS